MRETWRSWGQTIVTPIMCLGKQYDVIIINAKKTKISELKAFSGTIQQLQEIREGDRLRPFIMYPENEDMIYNYLYHGLKGFTGGREYVDIVLKANNPTRRDNVINHIRSLINVE